MAALNPRPKTRAERAFHLETTAHDCCMKRTNRGYQIILGVSAVCIVPCLSTPGLQQQMLNADDGFGVAESPRLKMLLQLRARQSNDFQIFIIVAGSLHWR